MYYFGVRYYAAWLGRWTSSDPGGFIDGLNLYRYVRNNPVNLTDPDGMSPDGPPDDDCEDPPCASPQTYTWDTSIENKDDIISVIDSENSYTFDPDEGKIDVYSNNYDITSRESLLASSAPYKLGYLWHDLEDYNANWFVYNSLQKEEVIAIGRFEHYGLDSKGKDLVKDSQTNLIITIEKYYVSYHDDNGIYHDKEPRQRILFSIFSRTDSAIRGNKRVNLSFEEFSNLSSISTFNIMESPFDFGVGKVGKAAKGARIVMNGFGGGKNSLVKTFQWAARSKAVLHYKKHVQGYKYKKGKEVSQSWDRADMKDFGYTNVDKYMDAAVDFLNQPKQNQLSFISKGGTYFKFDLTSGVFAMAGRDGIIQSFYKPKKGLEYFVEQMRKY